jgi:predicted transposase YbfD/YdcC
MSAMRPPRIFSAVDRPGSSPTLFRQLKTLPWTKIPVQAETHDRGHGRYEIRRLQVVSCGRLGLPHAAQAIRLTRKVRNQRTGRWRTVTLYAVTSLTAAQAGPDQLAGYIRGHWSIEVLHHIRDVTYNEDASQVRTGNAPRTMASQRNLAIAVLRHGGHANIAKSVTPQRPRLPTPPCPTRHHPTEKDVPLPCRRPGRWSSTTGCRRGRVLNGRAASQTRTPRTASARNGDAGASRPGPASARSLRAPPLRLPLDCVRCG